MNGLPVYTAQYIVDNEEYFRPQMQDIEYEFVKRTLELPEQLKSTTLAFWGEDIWDTLSELPNFSERLLLCFEIGLLSSLIADEMFLKLPMPPFLADLNENPLAYSVLCWVLAPFFLFFTYNG